VRHFGRYRRDGRAALDFEDPDGSALTLVDDGGQGAAHPWDRSPVPPEYQIRGLGYPVVTVPELAPTDRFLTGALGLVRVREYPEPEAPHFRTCVYQAAGEGPAAEVHLVVRDDLERARMGAGSVHHVALRVPDDAIEGWAERLAGLGYPNSGVIDRHWFQSVYVTEPNGVIFEMATDGPGFDVDEDAAGLGERLALPPRLEPRRAEIEARLRVIT
jgi:glyoxalase family protein